MSIEAEVARWWDDDAEVYDRSPGHHPTAPAVLAAWSAALARLLPPAPARVLDCGAGTGFLSLLAARLGHRVTAVDLSARMLGRLADKADRAGLEVDVVQGSAAEPPEGPYDAVIERHLIWTLPDPGQALAAWRASAPAGRLVLVEGLWGTADPVEAARSRARDWLRRWRGQAGDHHAEYPDALVEAMPLGRGTQPDRLVALVADSGWPRPGLERLRDVEWATLLTLPLPERLLGAAPRFVVTAG
jgi:SAM-dependent methyltransferase